MISSHNFQSVCLSVCQPVCLSVFSFKRDAFVVFYSIVQKLANVFTIQNFKMPCHDPQVSHIFLIFHLLSPLSHCPLNLPNVHSTLLQTIIEINIFNGCAVIYVSPLGGHQFFYCLTFFLIFLFFLHYNLGSLAQIKVKIAAAWT